MADSRWIVDGIDRQTGSKRRVEVQGAERESAERAAYEEGVTPTRVKRAPVKRLAPAPAARPAKPGRARGRMTVGEHFIQAVLWVVGFLMMAGGCLGSGSGAARIGSPRFDSTNAWGATANAVEDLSATATAAAGFAAVAAGGVCMILAIAIDLRAWVRNRA